MRDLAEAKYGRTASGDYKPNSWTLLDFGKCLMLQLFMFDIFEYTFVLKVFVIVIIGK